MYNHSDSGSISMYLFCSCLARKTRIEKKMYFIEMGVYAIETVVSTTFLETAFGH